MFNIIVDWEKMKKCSKEEKEELLRYIESLLEIRRNFNMNGIECFSNCSEDDFDDFERIAIDLVCQGYMPYIVTEVLSNLIQVTSASGIQYNKEILFTIFILMLQNGKFTLQDMKRILLSYLGIEYCKYILTESL